MRLDRNNPAFRASLKALSGALCFCNLPATHFTFRRDCPSPGMTEVRAYCPAHAPEDAERLDVDRMRDDARPIS